MEALRSRQLDMKGFLACMLAAVPTFLATPLRTPIHLAFSYDEEVGCLGVRSLLEYIKEQAHTPVACIVGEPTELKPILGHKGKLAMRCHVHGAACHSAYAPDGVNAIEYASHLIVKLTEMGLNSAISSLIIGLTLLLPRYRPALSVEGMHSILCPLIAVSTGKFALCQALMANRYAAN